MPSLRRGDGLRVQVQRLMPAQAGTHELGPAIPRELPGEEFSLAAMKSLPRPAPLPRRRLLWAAAIDQGRLDDRFTSCSAIRLLVSSTYARVAGCGFEGPKGRQQISPGQATIGSAALGVR